MTKRSSKSSQRKQRVNPLSRRIARVKAPKLYFDGLHLTSTFYLNSSTSLLNVASALVTVDCAVGGNAGFAPQLYYSASGDQSAITNRYQEYRYNNLRVHWLSQVAPGIAGAGSRVSIAYFDNAEIIASLLTQSSASLIPFVKACRNVKSWNAWENVTFNVPLTNRRKLFDVNTNSTYSTDTVDRAVQGLVVMVVESINASENLGQLKVEYNLMLKGLSTLTST